MPVEPPYGSGQRWLTVTEVAEWFNDTERHIRNLVASNNIPHRKVGSRLRFPEAELEVWSQPTPIAPPDAPKKRAPGGGRKPGRRAA